MTIHRNCEGITRRDCLKLGLGGLLGGGLVRHCERRLRPRASSEAAAKACILIWMDGGPSHYETFDPKPEAPIEFRGQFDAIPTKMPGVRFSQHMKRLAAIADKLAVIRSIRHDQGNHGAGNHYMMTGAPPRIPVGCGAFVSFHPSLGSATARECPAPPGLPAYFSLRQMSRSGGPNFLGLNTLRSSSRRTPTARFPRPRRGHSARAERRPVRGAQGPAQAGRSDGADQRRSRGRSGPRRRSSSTSRDTAC